MTASEFDVQQDKENKHERKSDDETVRDEDEC